MGVVISEGYPGGVVNNTGITTNQIFPVPSSLTLATGATTAAVCVAPGTGKLNGKYFELHIAGTVAAGASMNVTPILYSGTSITPGSNTIIATGTAFATGGAITTVPWVCTYFLQGDNGSGFLQVVQQQQFNNTFVAAAAGTKLTGVNFNTTDPAVSFVFGLTFSVANASNTATLTQFVLEA